MEHAASDGDAVLQEQAAPPAPRGRPELAEVVRPHVTEGNHGRPPERPVLVLGAVGGQPGAPRPTVVPAQVRNCKLADRQ